MTMSDVDQQSPQRMTAGKLLEIYKDLETQGVRLFLDGGWGVDALLGKETRPHRDVDFIIDVSDVKKVTTYFQDHGFKPSEDEESFPWHFILESSDAIADVHVVEFNSIGQASYGLKEWNAIFPAFAFRGLGRINGVEVRCLSAEYRVDCLTVGYGVVTRTGYSLKASDYKDIAKLCKHFNISMPEEYVKGWDALKAQKLPEGSEVPVSSESSKVNLPTLI